MKIAEIASGNGRYALEITKRLKNLENQMMESQVIAVEISPVGADLIKTKAESQSLNLEVICEDFLKMGLKMYLEKLEQFDVVFCSGFLEELETENEQIEAVSKMLKMVKVGGKIILKYCLFISGRIPENRVNSELIPNFLATFRNLKFSVETDPEIRFNDLSTIQDGQNNIRTQTIFIHKTS